MSIPAELRVMTYNVRSLRGDTDALGAVVRAHAPDVLLVQEAPRFLRWRSKRAALARRCGMVVATTDRPGGLCIMTALRVDLVDTAFSLLPKTSRRHQRAIVSATVGFAGMHWRVSSVHLSTDPVERRRHLPVIASALQVGNGPPLILGGDFNEAPGDPVFVELASRLQDCFAVAGTGTGATSPASSPSRRLDGILADPSLSVVSCESVDVAGVAIASDHLPVVAVLRQRPTAEVEPEVAS